MAVEIIYETHATTTDNENGISTGWLPGELSAKGLREAKELGERRRAEGVAAVFVSDLHRAVQTARIAFPDGYPPIHQDRRLRECDYGDFNGSPAAVVAQRRPLHIDEPFPGGQCYRQILTATGGFLHDLVTAWDGARVLVIAHTSNRWALDCLLNGASLEELLKAPFDWQPGWHYTVPSPASH
ncbi:histidine phosphatase family protein [Nonomuraea sp. NPDC050404]|uniref:histidine phosphatase family protein n=1 Tax=Nonomuraea sp. NPDC050404 TaxID=3155783 RepID=UPI0033EDB477